MAILGFSFGRDVRPPAILVTLSPLAVLVLGLSVALALDRYLPGSTYEDTGFLGLLIAAAAYGLLWLQYWQQKRRLAEIESLKSATK